VLDREHAEEQSRRRCFRDPYCVLRSEGGLQLVPGFGTPDACALDLAVVARWPSSSGAGKRLVPHTVGPVVFGVPLCRRRLRADEKGPAGVESIVSDIGILQVLEVLSCQGVRPADRAVNRDQGAAHLLRP
jgi:hypothetical protein